MSGDNPVIATKTVMSSTIVPLTVQKGTFEQPFGGVEYRVYTKRWLILLLYCLSAMSIMAQFNVYVVIADIIVDYYGVSYTLAQWTSLISATLLIIFIFPSMFLIDKLGLRFSIILGLTGTCVGSWMKMGSVDPSRFWLLLVGQGVATGFQALVTPLPSKVAAEWFGKDEVSKACSIAIASLTLALVLGNVFPSLLIQRGSTAIIESGLYKLGLTVAIFPSVMLILVILFFSKAPPTAPSQAQHIKESESVIQQSFLSSLKTIFFNKSYVMLLLLFGFSYGVQFPLPAVLNQIVLMYHPDAAGHIGLLGTTSTICGLIGSLVVGFILDKFKRYRITTVTVFIVHGLLLIILLSTLHINLHLIYFTYGLVGFFSATLIVVSFQLAVELTYPEPESTTGAILLSAMQAFGIGFTYLYEHLFNNTTELVKNLTFSLIIGCTLLLFFGMKFDLRRQRTETQKF